MALIGMYLTDISGTFELDRKEINLEWIVFSNNFFSGPVEIAIQGTINDDDNMIFIDDAGQHRANGWYRPGHPYRFNGNGDEGEWWNSSFAGQLEVGERKIIRGTGNYELTIADENIIVPITPSGIVQWTVKQKFSTSNEKAADKDGDQTQDPYTIKTSTEFEEVPFEKDVRKKKRVLNSAKDFFVPTPTRQRKIGVYSITRREQGNPVDKANRYSGVVNSDNWHGKEPGTVLMESVPCNFDGKVWSDVSYNLKYREDGWQTEYLDSGLNELVDGKLRPILNDEGTAVTEAVLLDGKGKKMLKTNPKYDEGITVGPFWKYKELSFDNLHLPDIFAVESEPQYDEIT
jgi:hypothetical protein